MKKLPKELGWLSYGHRRATTAAYDFELFCQKAPPAIEDFFAHDSIAREISEIYGLQISETSTFSLQVSLCNRSLFRKTYNGDLAIETGASLVFSLGPTGDVSVLLYPAKSNLGGWNDHVVFLDRGIRSAAILLERTPRYLKSLVSYLCVTSIEVKAPVGYQFRVHLINFWCRRLRPVETEYNRLRTVSLAGLGLFSKTTSGLIGQFSVWVMIALISFILGQSIDLAKLGEPFGVVSLKRP